MRNNLLRTAKTQKPSPHTDLASPSAESNSRRTGPCLWGIPVLFYRNVTSHGKGWVRQQKQFVFLGIIRTHLIRRVSDEARIERGLISVWLRNLHLQNLVLPCCQQCNQGWFTHSALQRHCSFTASAPSLLICQESAEISEVPSCPPPLLFLLLLFSDAVESHLLLSSSLGQQHKTKPCNKALYILTCSTEFWGVNKPRFPFVLQIKGSISHKITNMIKAPYNNKDAALIPGNSCLCLLEGGNNSSGLDFAPLRDKNQTWEKGK